MKFPRGVRQALRLPPNRERLAHELDDEVTFHLEQRVRELRATGMSEPDARAEALRRFGDAEDLRDYIQSIEVPHMRRMHAKEWWEGWTQDVRFAARQIARAPMFFAIAAVTLALGIAATTAIFSVVRGVVLRPLPYPDPSRLVQVWQVNTKGSQNQFSDPNYDDVHAQAHSFAAMAQVAGPGVVSVSGTSEPVRARASAVSRDFFAVLRVQPLMGRLFSADEMQPNGTPAALVSHGFWQRSLGGNSDALGKSLLFDGKSFTVVGVMPATLDFPIGTEIWVARELQRKYPSRTAHNWPVIARLADGVSLEQAQRDVSAVAKRLKQQYGDETWMQDAAVVSLQEQIVGRAKSTLLVLLAGSLVLLLIACANVVNLLIARMAARESEIAVRSALGAGRGRLAQQFLAESAMLALAAGVLGVGLARVGVRLLLALQPGNLPRMEEVRIDWQVLVFAIVVAVTAAAVMGFITAWRATGWDLREALSQAQRTQGGSLGSERVRRTLVVAQLAMAVMLLVATGLFARSFVRLLSTDPGFRAERQVVVDLTTSSDTNPARIRLYDELLGRFRAVPGVTAAGGINVVPLSGASAGDGTFLIMSRPDENVDMRGLEQRFRDTSRTGSAEFRVASPGYFTAMGIPLLRGRMFEDRDVITAPHVAVISQSLAQKRWPNDEPIGKLIQFGNMDGDMRLFTIVGVVGDVHEVSLASPPRPTFYGSYTQRPGPAWRFNFVLSTAAPDAVVNAARRIVHDLRPDLPPRIQTLDTIVSGSVADRRFVLSLVAVFGVAALVLAALGVYSVISYLVAQRGREISIRVALGARSHDIVNMVLRQGLALATAGVVVGTAASLAATRLIEKMLYGIRATDPVAFGGVVLVLGIVALVACWVPARRAARVDAMDVMRVG